MPANGSAGDHSTYQALGNGLTLRQATPADAGALLTFNRELHGSIAETVTQYLISGDHPDFALRDFLLVTDDAGQIVSSLCLIPVHWELGGTKLMLGQVELVGTRPEFRGRGLVRAQMDVVHRWMQQRGMAFGAILGIRYYYRLFSYEYAVDRPLAGMLDTAAQQGRVPMPPEVAVRRIDAADVPILVQLDQTRYGELDLRSADIPQAIAFFARSWRREVNQAEGWIAQAAGQVLGACWLVGEGDTVTLSGVTGTDAAASAFLASALALPGIRQLIVAESRDSSIGRQVSLLDPQPLPADAWYIRVTDPVQAVAALSRELEQRLAASPFAGLSRELEIGLYRSGVRIVFAAGRIIEVSPLPGAQDPAIGIPPDLLPKLLFGYRDLGELMTIFPDLTVGNDLELLRVLFPRLRALVRSLV